MTEPADRLRQRIRDHQQAEESERVAELLQTLHVSLANRQSIRRDAVRQVRLVRMNAPPNIMEAFLTEYGLSTVEGIAMMCLAEALLRVPDSVTVDALIEDKIVPGDWGRHLSHSASTLVNASTWALMLTGHLLEHDEENSIAEALRSAVRRLGEPAVRLIVTEAIKELGRQFVLGENIQEALSRGNEIARQGYCFSYDMLGEAACNEVDARRYHLAYSDAITDLSSIAPQTMLVLIPVFQSNCLHCIHAMSSVSGGGCCRNWYRGSHRLHNLRAVREWASTSTLKKPTGWSSLWMS